MGADQSVGATACLRARLRLAGPSALPWESGIATVHRPALKVLLHVFVKAPEESNQRRDKLSEHDLRLSSVAPNSSAMN